MQKLKSHKVSNTFVSWGTWLVRRARFKLFFWPYGWPQGEMGLMFPKKRNLNSPKN